MPGKVLVLQALRARCVLPYQNKKNNEAKGASSASDVPYIARMEKMWLRSSHGRNIVEFCSQSGVYPWFSKRGSQAFMRSAFTSDKLLDRFQNRMDRYGRQESN
jgi:hypothetical protein